MKIKDMKLPDFLIVGAAKSGTTSLFHYLKEHPQIYMPKTKEPMFFSFMNNPPNYTSPDPLKNVVWRLEDYTKLFDRTGNDQIIGEASPSYLYTYEIVKRNLRVVYGDEYNKVKIIIILRNPADRAWSQFMHFKKWLCEPLSFEEAIRPETIKQRLSNNWNIFYDYIGFGMYYEQVKAYMLAFLDVKVFSYSQLKEDSSKVIREILNFLGVDDSVIPQNVGTIYNVSGTVKNRLLMPFYKVMVKDDSNPRRLLRKILSKNKRKQIRKRLEKCFLKREDISPTTRKRLMSLYEKDIRKLKEIGCDCG